MWLNATEHFLGISLKIVSITKAPQKLSKLQFCGEKERASFNQNKQL